jgi:SepF-like predicted cell division protein (DUF552 family)
VRRKLADQLTHSRFRKTTTVQHQLCIRTVSIHNYTELKDLKGNLPGKEPTILIVRISPIVSKDPQAATKLVRELYSTHIKDNYSLFRIGEERFMVVPETVRVKAIL